MAPTTSSPPSTASQNAWNSARLLAAAALGGAHEGQVILDQAVADRARDRPLHRHRGEHGAERLLLGIGDAQAIERDEMQQRHREGGEDRDGQDLVGDGDADEGDDRHPDQIEDRDHDAERFRAEPVQPAEREFALLLAG